MKGKGGCAGDLRPTQASLDGAPELLGLVMGGATRLLRWRCAAERGDGDAKGVDIGVAEGDCDLGRAVLLDNLPLGHVRSGRISG